MRGGQQTDHEKGRVIIIEAEIERASAREWFRMVGSPIKSLRFYRSMR